MMTKLHANEVVVDEFRSSIEDVFSYHAGDYLDFEPAVAEFAVSYLFHERRPVEMVSAHIGMKGESVSAITYLIAASDTVEEIANSFVVCSLDWIGELSNLVAGAFKQKLNEYGVTAEHGLPTTRPGIHFDSPATRRGQDAVVVRTEFGEILAVINYKADAELPWERQAQGESELDGSICLF